MSGQDSTRRRDAAATRKALLNAATILFAERGFDRTTVRDIAVQAGVNQALLFRYFGSKEALFEEVIAGPGRKLLAASKPQRLLVDCLHGMLSGDSPDKHGSLKALLRSFDTDTASAAAINKELGDEYVHTLSTLTRQADAELRADLALAWLLGIWMLRGIAEHEPLTSANPEQVCALTASRTLLEDIDPARTSIADPAHRWDSTGT